MGSALGFLGNPLESMPRARDSGGPQDALALTAVWVQPSTRITASASASANDFGAESSRPASLLCTLRTHQSPGAWQHSLPACLLALAGRDLHPLDSDKRFHLLILSSSSSKLFPTRYPVVSADPHMLRSADRGQVLSTPNSSIRSRRASGAEAEQCLERGRRCSATVMPERKLVQVDLKLRSTDAMMGADEPLLQVANRAIGERHDRLGALAELARERLRARDMLVAGDRQPGELFSPSV